MSSTPTSLTEAQVRPRGGWLKRWVWVGVLGCGVGAVVLVAMLMGKSAPATDRWANAPTYEVKRGPLTISVDVAGSVRSAQAIVIKSEVEGRAAILSLVEEGTIVKQGDLLVELDSSTLADKKIDQEIAYQNAESNKIQASENLDVARKQAQADISAADVDLQLAQLDLKKYIEGEYQNELADAQKAISIAEAKQKLAAEKLEWSKKLQAEGYITLNELQGDELDEQSAQLEVESAHRELDLLRKFTYQRTLAKLQSDVDQKTFLLDKTKHKANSSIINAEADQRAKEASFNREKEKLGKLNDQISKCKIYAPVGGMVVYSTVGSQSYRSNSDPIAVGVEVTERQELMRLPTAEQMMADVKIHESVFNKIHEGLPVRITSDALPGKVYGGHVHRVATQPDSQSVWLNPDLKVFNTEIEIDGDTHEMRPGMSCRAEIIVEQLDNAMYVPVQAMMRVKGKPTVYLLGPDGPQPRPVKIGLDNNRMVHIIEGLEPGEHVLLTPPLAPSRVEGTSGLPEINTKPKHNSENAGPDASAPATSGPTGGEAGPGAGERPKGSYKRRKPDGGDAGAASDNGGATSGGDGERHRRPADASTPSTGSDNADAKPARASQP
ncbi:MAG: HlyD family efflux transporter periplasmic adaptor subunit [Planctomycetes bacterium]|nr:HlyD family efflux transporter periplasmic adaptor subunit [Planctomycetota bacterium]